MEKKKNRPLCWVFQNDCRVSVEGLYFPRLKIFSNRRSRSMGFSNQTRPAVAKSNAKIPSPWSQKNFRHLGSRIPALEESLDSDTVPSPLRVCHSELI